MQYFTSRLEKPTTTSALCHTGCLRFYGFGVFITTLDKDINKFRDVYLDKQVYAFLSAGKNLR